MHLSSIFALAQAALPVTKIIYHYLNSRFSEEVVERIGFSSSLWKRQVGRRLKADRKSVGLGRTPAPSVSATSKWKNG